MEKDKLRVIIGGLLHDIGKPAQRGNKTINHSDAGYDFLKKEVKITDRKILEQVRFHHAGFLKKAFIENDSLAYITYIADNIAAGADRKENDGELNGFNINKALEPVFNILNGNNQNYRYKPLTMDDKTGINYPTNSSVEFSREIYHKICGDIADCLLGIDENDPLYINSLLEIMEADCSFIPSSTNQGEVADISLYDHSKITAAVGSCIFDYLKENGINDYKSELYRNANDFYDKKAFLMYSFDVSGIQDFIYTIMSKGTLKMLRSRSFYIEILCEHFIDTLLERLELSRANLIYSGGGHGYIILANTYKSKKIISEITSEVNQWFMENFKTALYIASAYTECSANDLMNEKDGSYENIFAQIFEKLSEKKNNRYSCKDIMNMNYNSYQDGERECRICKRADMDIENDICGMCQKLIDMSDDILEKDFFVIMKNDKGLPLPFGKSLVSAEYEGLKSKLMKSDEYVRSYSKNKQYTGKSIATKLWIGDYYTEKEFEKLSEKSEGIKRIGVIRADVDNLGKAFVCGFDKKYVSLSRTATFSRNLSLFFKKHINTLFRENNYQALIVYSGGDDIFLVSAWSDTVKAAITLKDALEKFTQGTLTISAGIGIYTPKYPIASIAYESGALEEKSKLLGRNRVTLFSPDNSADEQYTYTWDELKENIIGEKKKCLDEYFSYNDEHGKNMIYNLLNYLRNISDKINIARYAYMLAKTEPDKDADELTKMRYRKFAKQMYDWALNKKDRLQLITAIYLYVYETREECEER